MERVFVAGATGFVGGRLVNQLASMVDADHVSVLSRSQHPAYITVISDLQTDSIPENALEGVDTVFHLAGYTHDLQDTESVAHLYQAVNVDATVRLASLAVSSGVQRFVFVSSVKAGGNALEGRCVTEEDQDEPEGIYGRTKREAELKVLEIGSQSGMCVSIVRPSLVYGPEVKGNLALMQLGVKKGWFPPLPETGNRRSMIHVDDLVRALVFVAGHEQTNGQVYIATDGVLHSSAEIYEAICHSVGKVPRGWRVPKWVFDLAGMMSSRVQFKLDKLLGDECYSSAKLEALGFKAEKVKEITGSKSELIHKPLPTDDPKQRQPDINLAKEVMRWEPRVTLEVGLKPTVTYFEKLLQLSHN